MKKDQNTQLLLLESLEQGQGIGRKSGVLRMPSCTQHHLRVGKPPKPFLWVDHWTHPCVSLSVVSDSLWPHGLYPVHGILQERIMELVAILFSRGSSWPWDRIHVSCISCINRWIFLPLSHLGSPVYILLTAQAKARDSPQNHKSPGLYVSEVNPHCLS